MSTCHSEELLMLEIHCDHWVMFDRGPCQKFPETAFQLSSHLEYIKFVSCIQPAGGGDARTHAESNHHTVTKNPGRQDLPGLQNTIKAIPKSRGGQAWLRLTKQAFKLLCWLRSMHRLNQRDDVLWCHLKQVTIDIHVNRSLSSEGDHEKKTDLHDWSLWTIVSFWNHRARLFFWREHEKNHHTWFDTFFSTKPQRKQLQPSAGQHDDLKGHRLKIDVDRSCTIHWPSK